MPYTLKPNKLFVKDPNGSGYLPQNVVTDRTTDDMVAEINSAGANQITAIGNKGTQTLETIPDDYTALSNQVDDVKSAFNTFVDERNIFWNAPFVSGKYYYGTAVGSSPFGYFIVPVTSGETYKFGCSVRFLSSQTTGIDNTEHDPGYQYTAIFTGDLYVTVRLAEADSFAMCNSDYDITEVGTTAQPRLSQNLLAQESGDSDSLAMSQAGVRNAISAVAVMRDGEGQVKPQNIEGVTVTGGNILDDAERVYCSQSGYVGGDGYVAISDSKAIIQNSSSFCSFLIAVKPNTHYTANNEIRSAVFLKNLATEGTTPVKYTTVVGSALANISSFDTGEADHIIVSWSYSTYPINTFIISEGNTASADIHVSLPDWWTGEAESVKPKYISTTGSLSNGTFIALMGYRQNLRKGERYVFSGNITTLSELHFAFTYVLTYVNAFSASTALYNEFTIDSTHVTYKTTSTNENYTYQYAHGLTFANNIQFIFEYLDEGNAKITLISNGVSFTQTLPFIKQTISQVVVLSVGSTMTGCKLSWIPIDIDKDIWMFGDSYFAYDSARWTYYLQQYGYAKNALLDGWPGEGSVNARNSLKTLIRFGTPKYIVWCMGMNDGSDTDASTPDSDWTVRRDEMLAICNENGITPIFATIPNVPSILHTGKNAWIKASGYRYIDFAAAVGAESAGSTWFSGMLSSDNVHPSESGAKALFARVLVDFPEIMIDE